MSENKSEFNWTFCQLLKWKPQLHESLIIEGATEKVFKINFTQQ
jgi:hypothetical protein